MAKTLFHIADVHIHDRNYDHIKYAWKFLLNDIMKHHNYETDVILVIAGDMFDHKTYLTACDVSTFYEMMDDLEQNRIQTIMIPGNHDFNINNSTSDKIEALIKRGDHKYVEYYPTSTVFEKAGLIFYIHSPIDGGAPKPSASHKGMKTVAIAHEPFSESRTCSGITFGTQRFSASMFSSIFSMTLLGDIHMPQLLARNVAYAGSFVQKNKGEDIQHGYMKWNVKTCNPVFHNIPQLSVHIKLWAHDNIMDKLPDVEARSITLYHTDCDDDKIKEFRQQINMKYKKMPIDVFDKTTIAPADVNIKTKHELNDIIKQKILDCKLDQSKIDRIITIHNDVFKQTEHVSITDWRIRFLSWSNVYCYGDENYINFDSIGNLTSMIGPNKVGKSSIIDIIMLILFNDTSRGLKKDALNVNSSSGYIKCVISVNDDVYAIERVWIDKKTIVVRVYKNDINVTESDINKTYNFLERIIGTKRIFINSTAALQHRQFIVDIDAKDIYDLVCKMMDLDRLRVIEDNNAAEIRLLRKQYNKMIEDMEKFGAITNEMINDKHHHLQKIKDALAKNTLIIANTYARRGEVIVDVVNDLPPSSFIADQLKGLEKYKTWNDDARLNLLQTSEKKYEQMIFDLKYKLSHINNEYNSINSKISVQDAKTQLIDVKADIEKLNYINVNEIINLSSVTSSSLLEKKLLLMNKRIELEKINMQIEKNKLNLVIIDKNERELNDIINQSKSKIVDINIDELEKNISLCKNELLKIAKPDCAKKLNFNAGKYDGIDLNANIIFLKKTINAQKDKLIELHDKIKMMNDDAYSIKLEMEKCAIHESTINNMKWNINCVQCKQNSLIVPNKNTELSRNANEIASTLLAIENERKRLICDIDEYTKKLNEYETARDQISIRQISLYEARVKDFEQQLAYANNRISISNAAKNDIAKCEQQLTAFYANKQFEELIAKDELKRAECKCELTIIETDINNLQKTIDDIKEPMRIINSSKELRDKYTLLLNDEILIDKMAVIDDDIKNTTVTLNDYNKKLEHISAEIRELLQYKSCYEKYVKLNHQYGISIASEDAADEIAELDDTIKISNDENKILSDELANAYAVICQYESNMKEALTRQKDIDSILQQLNDRDHYHKIINHKDGIPQSMMIAMCQNIENRCNDILREIADFEIEVEYNKEIYIFTKVGDARIPAEQSSGYQKFIIDLIMRQVLCALTTSANPRILFVDEGFGSLDKDNFDIVCKKVVPSLTNHFEKVIIISHIQGIHNYTTSNFVINNVNGRSHLQFGQLAFNGFIIRASADYNEQLKQTEECRALVIQEKKNDEAAQLIEAQRKQNEYGDGIFDVLDEKTIRCRACDKEFRNRNGFVKLHAKSKAHLKCMVTYK